MKILDLIIEIVKNVGKYIQSQILSLKSREVISISRDDITRRIDLVSEELIVEKLKKANINAIILTEEKGEIKIGKKIDYVIILDPLDGSTNFVTNIPFYSISIAFSTFKENLKLQDLLYGIVYNIPCDVMYIGDFENKEFKIIGNDFKLSEYVVEKPTIILYFEPKNFEEFSKIFNLWKLFNFNLRIRTLGSASLEIVNTLLKKFHIFIDLRNKLRIFDIAASYVISKVLNGIMVNEKGIDLGNLEVFKYPRTNVIASSDVNLVQKVVELLF